MQKIESQQQAVLNQRVASGSPSLAPGQLDELKLSEQAIKVNKPVVDKLDFLHYLATITNYHRLGGLNHKHFFLTVRESGKSKYLAAGRSGL